MRFPYKRSVGQDLRDLFGVQRLGAQARTLGNSSIRQGEGAIRLLGSDGTTVHAVLGDLPGGGYGLGVLSGGQIRTVPDIVSGATGPLSNRIGDLETFKTYADNQITSLNATTSSQAARLVVLEVFKNYADPQITNINNNLGDLNSNRTWQDGQITNINNNLGVLNAFRSYADRQITGLNGSVGSLSSSVGALAGRMNSVESKNSLQDAALAQANARATDLQQQIDVLRDRINRGGIPR